MIGINPNLKIHFIGLGGIGMSGIAEVLIRLGYSVQGSDAKESPIIKRLSELGATIFIGQKKENVQAADLVVFSSAIKDTNPELKEAMDKKIPCIKRAEMLAELMRLKFGIAVAGSHGKTTTTSLLATMMKNLGYKPTYIVGGVVKNLGSNAGSDDGKYIVAEADESDGSFLFLNPIISILTNIDNDHLDHYGSLENLHRAFEDFANKVPFYGFIALNAHDENIVSLGSRLKRPYLFFGIKESALRELDYQASSLRVEDAKQVFEVTCRESQESTTFSLALTGEHNVLNALGAIAVCHKLGSTLQEIAESLNAFSGVGRRLELLKKVGKATIIDDYGHHPTELRATIKTIREANPGKKIRVIFEPHRYTRTKLFWNDFVNALCGDFESVLIPIYAASEEPIPYIDSEILVKNINESGGRAIYTPKLTHKHFEASEEMIILTMGAGAISRVTREILGLS